MVNGDRIYQVNKGAKFFNFDWWKFEVEEQK
jgi:hypothetical protein